MEYLSRLRVKYSRPQLRHEMFRIFYVVINECFSNGGV